MFWPGAYIMIHKLSVCNKFHDHKIYDHEMGKVLPNRLYIFLALKRVSPNFCVILYLLFNGFLFWSFSKRTISKSNKQYSEPVVKNNRN